MKKALVLGMAATFCGGALADIYKCTDDSGHITYSNVSAKNCKRLIAGGDDRPPAAPSAGASKPAAAPTASPASFPRVDPATQKARDDDRRRILDSELDAEQKALDAARRTLTEQEAAPGGAKADERLRPYRDAVALHERNIQALRKEIANLR